MKKIILLFAICSFSSLSQAQVTLEDAHFWRPYDKRGINMFETGKEDTVAYDGIQVRLGGGFAQQFQGLSHSNSSVPNPLIEIGNGFNLATANLNLDVALADGIRLNLITYLSSRHHPETWVKGGFIQVDKVPFLNSPVLDGLFEKFTLKVGHMEINYGDAHFRRTDNANAFYNPFVGNYIMDAFTTEIGAEVIYQSNGLLAVASVTGGELQGGVTNPDSRKPSFIGKLGYDKQIEDNVRIRLTGSVYHTAGSSRNTLYAGDRTGSRYYLVMEPEGASTSANFTSGRFNPGQTDNITALVLNPFIKVGGFEFFGNLEQSSGKAANEPEDRKWNQVGADVVYRFGMTENFYLAGRYNQVNGEMQDGSEASIDRVQIGGGWFVTGNILAKLEYVNQNYNDFGAMDVRNGGNFNGFMIEGVIAF